MNIDHADSTQPRDTTEEWAEYLERKNPQLRLRVLSLHRKVHNETLAGNRTTKDAGVANESTE